MGCGMETTHTKQILIALARNMPITANHHPIMRGNW